MILGSHLSISGGLKRALESAGGYGFDAVALFVANQRQWRRPPLDDAAVAEFRRVRRRLGILAVVAHGSYLVNLASGQDDLLARSRATTADELDRCGRLGIDYLVIHPGSWPDAAEGVRRIAEGLNEIVAASPRRCRTKVLLETTAAAGASVGGSFEQLADLLGRLRPMGRFGVCLDTCHVFAAGYGLRTERQYHQTLATFDATVGLERLLVIHLNDSKGRRGSHLDRHAHIGRGLIGRAGFRHLVNDPRFAAVPMILETPKGLDDRGRDWDSINAATIRKLVQ